MANKCRGILSANKKCLPQFFEVVGPSFIEESPWRNPGFQCGAAGTLPSNQPDHPLRSAECPLKVDPPFVIATQSFVEAKTIMELMSAIDLRIDRFREERLHPRVVEGLPGITPAERRRWTKDRRLRSPATDHFAMAGRSFSVRCTHRIRSRC